MTIAFDIRTTPFSRWSVENVEDEPAHSYFARLVAAEGHNSVVSYSNGIDVNGRNIDPEALLEVLLKLPLAEERKQLLCNATPKIGNSIRLAGQNFRISDFSFSSRRWCPGCLHESPHHRAWWDITAITECPFHGERLQDQDEHGSPIRWWWPHLGVSPKGSVLSRPMLRRNGAPSFAGYIVGRLGFGPLTAAPLLDAADLGSVISVCELIGRLISSPFTDEVPMITAETAEIGFQALCSDAVHFVETLRTWIRSRVPDELLTRGYTIVFGWANRQRQVLDDKQLAHLLKRAFRKALALEARSSVETLTSEDFLTGEIGLTDLAARIGINRRGLPAVADALGLLPDREWYRAPVKFDPAEADAIEFHIRSMMTRLEVGAALGLASQEIRALVNAGYLREFANVATEGASGLRFLKTDVEIVLTQLAKFVELDPRAESTGFFTFGKKNGMREGDLAVAILRGHHSITSTRGGKPGFKDVRIISNASRTAPRSTTRTLKHASDLMSLAETEAELNLNRQTLYRLIEDGHLAEQQASGNSRLLTRTSVLEFGSRHRNAREILPYFGGNLDQLVNLMSDHDVDPLLERRSKHEAQPVNVIYRYADLAMVLGLGHDPTRFDDSEFEAFWQNLRSLCADTPPYLLLPSRLPVCGQTVSNGKRTYSFVVTYASGERNLVLEGKRQAAGISKIILPMTDEAAALISFQNALRR